LETRDAELIDAARHRSMKRVADIHRAFGTYRGVLQQVWQNYCLLDYYLPLLIKDLAQDKKPGLRFNQYVDDIPWTLPPLKAATSITSITNKYNVLNAFLNVVAVFEDYVTTLIAKVYRDFPGNIPGATADTADGKENHKVLGLVIESRTIAEVLDKVIEEKVRSLFYGNPADLFAKDKARVGLGDYYAGRGAGYLGTFIENTARRNVLIHSGGKADRKYVREVKGTTVKEGERLAIDGSYLRTAILNYENMAGSFTSLVLANRYKARPGGRLRSVAKRTGLI